MPSGIDLFDKSANVRCSHKEMAFNANRFACWQLIGDAIVHAAEQISKVKIQLAGRSSSWKFRYLGMEAQSRWTATATIALAFITGVLALYTYKLFAATREARADQPANKSP